MSELVTAKLVTAARSYLGVPFQHEGRTRDGLDCVGMLRLAARDIGIPYEDDGRYPRTAQGDRMTNGLTRNLGAPLPKETELRVGDIVHMQFGRDQQHVAIIGNYLYGGLSVIHTDATLERVIEHRLDFKWARRIVAIYRLKD